MSIENQAVRAKLINQLINTIDDKMLEGIQCADCYHEYMKNEYPCNQCIVKEEIKCHFMPSRLLPKG